jgi:hypothetical protein
LVSRLLRKRIVLENQVARESIRLGLKPTLGEVAQILEGAFVEQFSVIRNYIVCDLMQ